MDTTTMMAVSTFTVQVTPADSAVIVRLTGHSSGNANDGSKLRGELLRVYGAVPRLVVVDLSELQDINSAVLGALLLCRRLSVCADGILRLAGVRPAVSEVLAQTGLLALFECLPDVKSALSRALSQ